MEMMMKMKKYEIAELSDGERVVWDTETNEHFNFESAVACLNEQQAIIRRDETSIKTMMSNMKKLEEENEQLRNELDKYKIVILQFVGLLVENGIIDSSVKEEVDELLEELSGDGDMTNKRFIFVDNIFKYLETGIKDNKSDYDSLNGESVVDLLNELVEENEQLRHELDSLTGCYCADNKEFKDYWRIGYDD